MAPALPRALHAVIEGDGHSAFALRDKFPTNISDIDLYNALAGMGSWIVISKDLKNAKRPPERAAIMHSGALAFYLNKTAQKQRLTEQAATIIWQWPRLLNQRNNIANGMFELPTNKGSKFKSL